LRQAGKYRCEKTVQHTERAGGRAPNVLRSALCAATIVLGSLGVASATTYRELSLDELVARAELGFFGAVSEVTVEARGNEPYTSVTFTVSRALEGDLDERVTLEFYGGTLPNGRTVDIEGMPEFTRGDELIVLAYDAPYYSPIVGFSQGLWRATPDGFEDRIGRRLSLSDAGRLLRDGEGGERETVLDALAARLEATP